MIKTDTHLHSSLSSDSQASMESMVQGGIALGMKTLCFTEHYDMDFPEIPSGLDFSLDFDAYYEEWSRLKEQYGDRIELLHGIELGVQPHLGSQLNAFYEEYGNRYDFIISSCHLVERLDPYYPELFDKYGPVEGMRRYFETSYENLKCFNRFQSVGHLDYASRYIKDPDWKFHYADYGDILDKILTWIIDNGKALEINTSGLKAGLPWPNPHMEILQQYRSFGGRRITIGSDAHRPEHMAYDYYRLPEILAQIGFDRYEIYRKQVACPVMLWRQARSYFIFEDFKR